MPKRVQMSRQHPWRAENPDAVIVARPSRWGNPYVIGWTIRDYAAECARAGKDPDRALAPIVTHITNPPDWMVTRKVRDAADAVECFRQLMAEWTYDDEDAVEAFLLPLKGHDLACWCKPGEACHADVLLELANPPEEQK